MRTVAERLVAWLRALEVEVIFGIPGVHTIELYRALAGAGIRHVTPRTEAGAGFMADGYARVSGRFGVALVITGPGLTNILTPMAQARADSVPMLVISGVNRRDTLGKGFGYLHELPDQLALTATLGPALHLDRAEDLPSLLDRAATALTTGRGGPVHLQIPLDLMTAAAPEATVGQPRTSEAHGDIKAANRLLEAGQAPVLLAGGGCRRAEAALRALAERLGAPVILTTNARGLLHGHPLVVPASPSLAPVRDLIRNADPLLVLGSELGPTDCDMYGDGGFAVPAATIRVEIDAEQLARHPVAVALPDDVATVLPHLTRSAPAAHGPARADETRRAARAAHGPARADETRRAARAALPAGYADEVDLLERLRDSLPGAIMVGDSTQVVYAGNLYYDHDRAGGWFNAATGYGALGYATGAAVGAALAEPGAHVLCLIGDGGLMFALGEVLTAAEEGLNITFIVFNNRGFGEIASAMRDAGAEVIGCAPRPPELAAFANACGLPFERATPATLRVSGDGPRLIEVVLPSVA